MGQVYSVYSLGFIRQSVAEAGRDDMDSPFGSLSFEESCAKDLFSYASEYVRQFNELDQCDRHDLWDGMDLSEI